MTKDYWLYCNFFSTYVWHLFFLERVLNLVIFLYVNNIPNIKNDNRHKYSSSSSKPFPINLELALSLSVLFCPSLLYPVTLFPVCLSASSHINDSLSYLYRASSGCHMPKLFSNDILWFFSFIDFFFFLIDWLYWLYGEKMSQKKYSIKHNYRTKRTQKANKQLGQNKDITTHK